MRLLFRASIVVVLLAAGCQQLVTASPVEGIVRSVDSAGIGEVRGFEVLTTGGETIEFALGTLENPTEFPPSHLAEHQATSQPVRVFFRSENGVHTVYRLEDASG